jgi:FSR family fosmidomycin resistance protein-like MFS transporter
MSLFLDAIFSSVAFSHFAVDLLNGQRAVLLTFVAVQLGLSNTALGLATTVYTMSAALIQPFAGVAADRYGARWVTAGGVLWMAVFFSLGLLVSGQASIILLVIASAGSGAFHPAGTMQATLVGRNRFAGRETTAASYFFVFGQMGYFFGPMLAGPLLDHFGPVGLLSMSLLAFPVGLVAARNLRGALKVQIIKTQSNLVDDPPSSHASPHRNTSLPGTSFGFRYTPFTAWLPILAFILMACFQAWASQNMTTFIPKYLSDLGQSASVYGLVAALYTGGTAVGNLLGGSLSDRYGARRISAATLALASLPLYLMSSVGFSWLFWILVPLAGILVGATNSVIVVQGQTLIPGGMALASGLVLGLTFSSGALGTFLTGRLADLWGFGPVFQQSALLALAASLLALAIAWKKTAKTAG